MGMIEKSYDFVVVGGGISGISTAIAAARHGVKTALIQDRSVLGGNSSSEMRVHLNGAGRGDGFQNAIESGIVLELLLANKKQNPQYSFYAYDTVLWEKVAFQENLDLYLNTSMIEVLMEEGEEKKIKSIVAYQMNTEKKFQFSAKYFSDNTGDGTLGFLAGADYRIGHEAKSEYGESLAPEVANDVVMGSSVSFSTKDMGKPTKFVRPAWAYEYTKEMLGKRSIDELTHGYWWIELDGTIEDSQNIKDELMKYVYGVWDYIKNSGDYPDSENLALDWISSIAGKRESRRLLGDYVLHQNDIDQAKAFPHTIAYGGWSMDDHTAGGIKTLNPMDEGTIWHEVNDIYTIPYECIYSRNVVNLYIGGRCFSASHMALSSARVMATGGILGQAAGTAVSIALRENMMPKDVVKHIHELQQTLIRDDCYLPHIPVEDKEDLISNGDWEITASSQQVLKLNGDFSRRVKDTQYGWISEKISPEGEWIQLNSQTPCTASQILLRFDPNFSKTNFVTQSKRVQARQDKDMPLELVKSYELTLSLQGNVVKTLTVEDNFQRVMCHALEHSLSFDCVKVTVKENYGDDFARIFDLRAYA